MKNAKWMLKGVVLSLLVGPAFAQDYDGHIVKLAEGSKAFQDKTFKSLGEVREIPVSFGNFVHLDAELDQKSLKSLELHPEVEYVEPNYLYSYQPVSVEEVNKVIEDGKYADQWGLKNTGDNSGGWFWSGKEGEDVNAERAWDITKGSEEIVVAVIDTGIDYNHPDLKNNLHVNEAELNGEEGVDDDGNGFVDDVYGYNFVKKSGDPMDGNGHGTHCAGVIGGVHNSEGIRGVMADVKMFGVKFLSDSGSGSTEDAILSIDYAVKRGADVLSNSWGGGGRSEALKEAIVRANEAGAIFVAAAGNSRADNDSRASYPANYDVDNVISVGAMDGRGKKSSFSNYGKEKVHVFAPGSNILSTVQDGRYKKMSGTSMAAPFVSGIAGLILNQESTLTTGELRQRIVDTAVNNDTLIDYAQSGRIDAYRALMNIQD